MEKKKNSKIIRNENMKRKDSKIIKATKTLNKIIKKITENYGRVIRRITENYNIFLVVATKIYNANYNTNLCPYYTKIIIKITQHDTKITKKYIPSKNVDRKRNNNIIRNENMKQKDKKIINDFNKIRTNETKTYGRSILERTEIYNKIITDIIKIYNTYYNTNLCPYYNRIIIKITKNYINIRKRGSNKKIIQI